MNEQDFKDIENRRIAALEQQVIVQREMLQKLVDEIAASSAPKYSASAVWFNTFTAALNSTGTKRENAAEVADWAVKEYERRFVK